MASLRQLSNKIKTLQDFQKVVNIEKIVVMKEISELKKVIRQFEFRNALYNNLLIDIKDRYGVISPGYFSARKNKVPIKRTLYFIVSNAKESGIGIYSNKLIIEHLRKSAKKEDLFVIMGAQLCEDVKAEGYNVINTIPISRFESGKAYESIASQVIRGYKDLMFVDSQFLFFDIGSRDISNIKLFPFNRKKSKLEDNKNDFIDENLILNEIRIGKVRWYKDLTVVSDQISQLAINLKSYYVMVKYQLDSKMRELHSLDDKEKNILEEIDKIKLTMQRVRQENVTNELLTNAVAFGAINDEEAN